MEEYIKYDDWWVQFEKIKFLIKECYENCCMLKECNIYKFKTIYKD